jgi:hypothetical protein
MAIKTAHPVDAKGQLIDVERDMAMIEKAQQLAGHFPDAEALDRARRVLEGEITAAEGYAELDAKYSR